jgi:hypothetical protein
VLAASTIKAISKPREELVLDMELIGHGGTFMEEASTSETSVNFYQTTRCNIPEDSHLQDYVGYIV